MSTRRQVFLLIIISILLFFLRLGGTGVYQVAEARNAECAREMLVRDNPIVPVFNGELRTDKPALTYFFMMAAYTIGGVSEGSARFFSALCGLLLVISTFLIGLKYLGKKAAWWSALTLLASPHLIVQFRLATPDPYLILCDTLALYCFIEGRLSAHGRAKRERRWYAGMYILLGLAMLAKGPVGLLLPGAAIFFFLLVKKEFTWKTMRRLKPWWGILLTLLFSAPWYVLVHIATNGAWTKGFFLKHNIGRFSGAMGGHGGIFLLTFLFVFVGMLPFSVFIVHTLGYVWKRRKQNDLLLFSLVAFACIVIFYSISRTKLINYTVPCYPFLALMTGAFLAHLTEKKQYLKGLKIPFILLLVICAALPAGFYFWTRSNPELHHFSWLAGFFALFPAGALLAFIFFLRGNVYRSFHTIAAAFMISTAIIFAYPYPLLDAQTPVRKATFLFHSQRPVVAYQRFNNAFVFYIRHPVPVVKNIQGLQQFLQRHTGAWVISDAGNQAAPEHTAGLKLIRKDREIFNSHTSYIYSQEAIPPARQ